MSSIRQIRLVAWREMHARLTSKAYQVSTVAIAVLIVGGVLATQILPELFEDDPIAIGLTPATAPQAEPLLASTDVFDREVDVFSYADATAALAALEEGEVDAVLVAPDQLTQVFAGVAVLAGAHALVDVAADGFREGKAHGVRAHGVDDPPDYQ